MDIKTQIDVWKSAKKGEVVDLQLTNSTPDPTFCKMISAMIKKAREGKEINLTSMYEEGIEIGKRYYRMLNLEFVHDRHQSQK